MIARALIVTWVCVMLVTVAWIVGTYVGHLLSAPLTVTP